MFPSVFQTPRLLLRPIDIPDARPIFDGYAQDPEVSRYLTWRPHSSIKQTEAYVKDYPGATTYRTYVLVRKVDQTVVGAFDLRQPGAARLGYGYVLARASGPHDRSSDRGRRLGAPPTVDLAHRRCLRCRESRLGALMEKAGLEREGVIRRWSTHPNLGEAPRDCFSYAKVR